MEDEFLDSRGRLLYVISLSGLNGKDFAAKVNVSPSTISQITSASDKARKTGLSEMVVNRILSAFPQFNLSYEWLLNGVGPRTVPKKLPESLFDVSDQVAETYEKSPNKTDELQSKQPVNFAFTDNTADVDNAFTQSSDGQGLHKNQVSRNGDEKNPTVDKEPFNSVKHIVNAHQNSSDPLVGDSSQPSHDIPPKEHDFTLRDGFIAKPERNAEIERIVIFYSDGTFTDYSPRKKQ